MSGCQRIFRAFFCSLPLHARTCAEFVVDRVSVGLSWQSSTTQGEIVRQFSMKVTQVTGRVLQQTLILVVIDGDRPAS